MSEDSIVEFRKVSKRYDDIIIFNEFDMHVMKGEMVCIAGESGSGKSTILNLIGMFDQPDDGEIFLFGQKIPQLNTKLGREYLRSRLLYVFQNFALIESKNIDYNLEIPLMNTRMSRKEKKMKKIEALSKVGLNVSLDTKVFRLSGGEQQRVALARGYLKDFDLVLADEPTGSLDAKNRNMVISMLHDFNNQGKTVIVVSHDPIVMDACDRIIPIGKPETAEIITF